MRLTNPPNPMDPPRLHSGYVAWLVGLTVLGIGLDAFDAPAVWRGIVVGGFLVVEIVGAFVRRGLGDTWSEINWTILRGRPALYPVALGWLGWYLWQWAEILPWEPDPGMVALFVGAVLWWPAHLVWEGRHG